jgi:hypothetical protein
MKPLNYPIFVAFFRRGAKIKFSYCSQNLGCSHCPGHAFHYNIICNDTTIFITRNRKILLWYHLMAINVSRYNTNNITLTFQFVRWKVTIMMTQYWHITEVIHPIEMHRIRQSHRRSIVFYNIICLGVDLLTLYIKSDAATSSVAQSFAGEVTFYQYIFSLRNIWMWLFFDP